MSIEEKITNAIKEQLGSLLFETIRLSAIIDNQQEIIDKIQAELKETDLEDSA